MPSDRYTKKPVTVEAIQYTGANLREVLDFTGKHPRWGEWFKSFEDYEAHVCSDRGVFKVLTLEGTMEALPGDWIIRGVKGEHYPCKPDIFAATYTRADLCASGSATPTAQEAEPVDVRKCQTCQGFGWIKNALNKCPNCAIPPACQQEAVPVAWRCKDYADGWIVYGNKAQAELYQAYTGCLMEALYVHPPQPSEAVA